MFLPNGRAGIMDIGPLDPEPVSLHNGAAHAVAVGQAAAAGAVGSGAMPYKR